jgi:ubiquinone/menaquinone biosynthesis C-methylase UbiE
VQKIVDGSNKILDVGVGTGRMIPLYAPLVKEYVGIDNADI